MTNMDISTGHMVLVRYIFPHDIHIHLLLSLCPLLHGLILNIFIGIHGRPSEE